LFGTTGPPGSDPDGLAAAIAQYTQEGFNFFSVTDDSSFQLNVVQGSGYTCTGPGAAHGGPMFITSGVGQNNGPIFSSGALTLDADLRAIQASPGHPMAMITPDKSPQCNVASSYNTTASIYNTRYILEAEQYYINRWAVMANWSRGSRIWGRPSSEALPAARRRW